MKMSPERSGRSKNIGKYFFTLNKNGLLGRKEMKEGGRVGDRKRKQKKEGKRRKEARELTITLSHHCGLDFKRFPVALMLKPCPSSSVIGKLWNL
jgi:hypothetical protein